MNFLISRKTNQITGSVYYEIRRRILFFFSVLCWQNDQPLVFDTESEAIAYLQQLAESRASNLYEYEKTDFDRRLKICRIVLFCLFVILASSWLNRAHSQEMVDPCGPGSRFAPAFNLEFTSDPGFIIGAGLHAYESAFGFFAGVQAIVVHSADKMSSRGAVVPRFEMLYRMLPGFHAYLAVLPGAGSVEAKTRKTDPIGAGLVCNYQIGPLTAIRIRGGYEGRPIFGLGIVTLFK